MNLLHVSARAWACNLYVNVCCVRHGQPERCTYRAWVSGRGRSHCTCTCTVFVMDSLNGVSIVCGCINVGVHTVLVLVQCLA